MQTHGTHGGKHRGRSRNETSDEAIRFGMRDESLRRYAREWIVSIEDVSDFVSEQRKRVEGRDYSRLVTPPEKVYNVHDLSVAARLGIEPAG